MIADTDKITKLLQDSRVTRYKISKDTGIAQSTLSDIATGKVELENIRMSLASKLTSYYEKLLDLKPVELEDVFQWLFEYRTVTKYDLFKHQPETLENIQPTMLVTFYTSTLKEEAEECNYEQTLDELAKVYNLNEVREDEQFIQLNIPDWSDTDNATSFYLSEVYSEEDFISLVNKALELDKVAHNEGLKPRYQIN